MFFTQAYKHCYIHISTQNKKEYFTVQDNNFKMYSNFKSLRSAKIFITKLTKVKK